VRADAYKGLAWAKFNLEEYDLAKMYFQESIRFGIGPTFNLADSYNGLGWVYLRRDECDEAIPYFEQSLELNPVFPDPQRGLEVCQDSIELMRSMERIHPQGERITRIREHATVGLRNGWALALICEQWSTNLAR
jgi:tetratricopeptide (TPR) repeat protein